MSKNKFNLPILLSNPEPTDDNQWGGGTGLGGENPVPMAYNSWINSQWFHDYGTNGPDFMDYVYWWMDQHFDTGATWSEFNPDTPWNPDWEED